MHDDPGRGDGLAPPEGDGANPGDGFVPPEGDGTNRGDGLVPPDRDGTNRGDGLVPPDRDGTSRGDGLAPVVPLFGGAAPVAPVERDEASDAPADEAERWHTTWRSDRSPTSGGAGLASARTGSPWPIGSSDHGDPAEPGDPSDPDESDEAAHADRAERSLQRALAMRGMSEREARDRLRRESVDAHAIEDIVDRLLRVGALDDDRLADQLVYAALTRKNQGRRAISQSLAKRGVAREAIDRALDAVPDDDEERALEFARGRARSLARYDRDTALRRLIGQLSRRGFGGSLAMTVATRALDDAQGSASGVRFR